MLMFVQLGVDIDLCFALKISCSFTDSHFSFMMASNLTYQYQAFENWSQMSQTQTSLEIVMISPTFLDQAATVFNNLPWETPNCAEFDSNNFNYLLEKAIFRLVNDVSLSNMRKPENVSD